jgi:two-component system, chemotaxis family, protein-glutamate methylesterase/glutaminase
VSRFDVVAIGASLGGLSAIETLLEALPKSYPAAVVIVQHRRADAGSGLLELLRSHSALPVSEPEDKQPLEPGHVYLAPPNYHMLVERGLLSLSIDPPVAFARPSIDVLFESVADAYGARALAVVLTGKNHDGAAGAAAIKRHGGVVLVQDPGSAEAPETPSAALAATRVDAVLRLPALALRLSTLTSDESC